MLPEPPQSSELLPIVDYTTSVSHDLSPLHDHMERLIPAAEHLLTLSSNSSWRPRTASATATTSSVSMSSFIHITIDLSIVQIVQIYFYHIFLLVGVMLFYLIILY
jgi:hypothetical protein